MIKNANLVRGFTLIELLVVIAIIGILSSVVLSSLNVARSKGANAAVKNNLANMRVQAEFWYDEPIPTGGGKTYSGLCGSAKFATMTLAAHVASGATNPTVTNTAIDQVAGQSTNCHSGATYWVVQANLKLPENGNGFWCVDYKGASKPKNSVLSGGTNDCG